MAWLKRNLVLVAGGVVALILLGGAGFFLYTKRQANNEVSALLVQAEQEFRQLMGRNPSVSQENIEAARTEQKRVSAMLEENRKHFGEFTSITNISSAEFKSLLETTISGLNDLADGLGVRRPSQFNYTFPEQRRSLVFDPADLVPWTHQLMEIKALCEVFYRARVHSVTGLRRAPIKTREAGYYILAGVRPATNTVAGVVLTPYEVVFNGFSSELAVILDQLARAPHCFLVKNIDVQRAERSGLETSGEPTAAPGYPLAFPGVPAPDPAARSTEQLMRDRYGLGPGRGGGPDRTAERYGISRPTRPSEPSPFYQPVPHAPVRRGPETVLDEQLLKFTVRVDAVRPMAVVR
jgi:hypothetical protein